MRDKSDVEPQLPTTFGLTKEEEDFIEEQSRRIFQWQNEVYHYRRQVEEKQNEARLETFVPLNAYSKYYRWDLKTGRKRARQWLAGTDAIHESTSGNRELSVQFWEMNRVLGENGFTPPTFRQIKKYLTKAQAKRIQDEIDASNLGNLGK